MKKILLLTIVWLISFTGFSQCFTPTAPLNERVNEASIVIEGEVISKNSYWDTKRNSIYTINVVKPYKQFKSLSNTSATVNVLTLGGTVGLDQSTISGALELNIGEKGVFMLKNSPVSLPVTGTIYGLVNANQGFIKYDLYNQTAHDGLKAYRSIENVLYKSIESVTRRKHSVLLKERIFSNNIDGNSQRAVGITSISPSTVNAGVGDVITISGTDFGTTQGTINFRDADTGGESWISAYASDIVSWTDTSIQVKVISRASTGTVQVVTSSGSVQSSQSLTVNWSHRNATSAYFGTNTNYETNLRAKDGNGGYLFQYAPNFTGNSDAKASFEAMMQNWNCSTSVNFGVGSDAPTNIEANDDVNIVMFKTSAEIVAGGGSTNALAYVNTSRSGCVSGAVLDIYVKEIDIVINSDINWYYGDGTPSNSQVDFKSVLLHELGHAHELGHVGQNDDIMYYSIGFGQQNRTIGAQVLNGGNYVFNKSTTTQVCTQPSMTAVDTSVSINTQPVSFQTCEATGAYTFSINATGAEAYQWQRYNSGTGLWEDLINNTTYSGVDTASLTYTYTNRSTNSYRCKLTGICGDESFSSEATFNNTSATENVTLNVIPNACNLGQGSFTVSPANLGGLPSIELSIDGGINYSYTFNLANPSVDITGLPNGNYNFYTRENATDNCPKDQGVFTIDNILEQSATATVTSITDVSGCGNTDGQILLSFNPVPTREFIYISLDGGNTYPNVESIIEGSYSYNTLTAGDYNIFVAYNPAGLCATDLGIITVGGCDTEPPVAICQDFVVALDSSGMATIVPQDIDNNSTDNVGIVSWAATPLEFTCGELGPNTVTLTVTDATGNSNSCNATVTVIDDLPPARNATPDLDVELDINGEVTVTTTMVETLFSDNCGSFTTNFIDTTFTCTEVGVQTISVVATDAQSNSATIPITINVTAPALSFCNEADIFISTWRPRFNNETITIPVTGTGYNYLVDWGDGTHSYHSSADSTASASHVYPAIATYTVRIVGDFPRIYFNNTGSKNRIRTVQQWGAIQWTSMVRAFRGCNALNIVATDAPDLSNVTDMNGMFSGDIDFTASLNHWDVSNITVMRNMFSGSTFNHDISSWDVSNVQDFENMFYNVTELDQSFGNWDISSASNMVNMFNGAGLSTTNYDNTLIGWATLDTAGGETAIPNNINFNAGTSQYCLSEVDRETLINTRGWTINDAGNGCDPSSYFITTWQTATANETITIPTTESGYDYLVDWGDGFLTTHSDIDTSTDATHTYSTAGTYTVKILGDFPRIYFNNNSEEGIKLKSVDQWGTIKWTNFKSAFAGCNNIIINATDAPDLSNVQDLSNMFGQCYGLSTEDFNGWDTSTITNMSSLFRQSNFNGNISSWNVSQVENFRQMFYLNDVFNQDLSSWDTSSAINMFGMFDTANSFDQNLGTWDISNVTNMSEMFDFGSGLSTDNYDATLTGWATLNADLGETQIPTNITFGGGNSQYCYSEVERQNLISTYGWTITDAGKGCDEADYFITTWQTTTTNESITIPTTGTGYDYTVDWGDGNTTFHSDADASTDATHIYATAGTYTVKVLGDFPRIYFNDTGDKDKIVSVEQWGIIQWTSMKGAFSFCNNLTVNATDAPDLSNVTSLNDMFSGEIDFNVSLSNWDVSTITTLETMFFLSNFNGDISGWNVSNVTNLTYTFAYTPNFNQDISGWDVSAVISFEGTFFNSNSFNQNLGAWDISNALYMESMLGNVPLSTQNYDNTLMGWVSLDTASGETQIPNNINLGANGIQYCLSEIKRQELINTYGWTITDGGKGCNESDYFITTWQTTTANESITIPTTGTGYDYLIDWGDGTVTAHSDADASTDATHTFTTAGTYTIKILGDFPRIHFNSATDKTKIQTIEQWGTIQWTSMEGAFEGCNNITSNATDAPDLSNVSSLNDMFKDAIAFNGIVDHWDVSTITSLSGTFRNARNFNQPINSWDVSNVQTLRLLFNDAQDFNQPLDNWDVSNVTSFEGTFKSINIFNQNLGNWDISNANTMTDILLGNTLSKDNYDATLIGWATLDTAAGETQIPTDLTFHGGNSQYCLSEIKRQNLIDTYGWTITDGGKGCNESDYFITTWQTTIANESITIPTTGTGYDYLVDWGDGTLTAHSDADVSTNATHTYDTAGTYTVKITGDFPRILVDNVGQANTNKIISVDQWGTIPWTSFESAFSDCKNLVINATDIPDLSNVSSLESMFYSTIDFNVSLSNWDVSTITNMELMFSYSNFNGDISTWNVSNVTIFYGMFEDAFLFNQDISNWDTSSATDMEFMFYGAEVFNQDLSQWDISNVSSMGGMLDYSNLSIENYDATLIGWATLDTTAGETQIPTNVELEADGLQYCISETHRQDLIDNYDWTITDSGKQCLEVYVSPKVYLQGAALNRSAVIGEEDWMQNALHTNSLVPYYSPYIDGGDNVRVTEFTRSLTDGDAMVDWIWVELRDATDPAIVIDGQSAILQRDGDVVDPRSALPSLTFNQEIGDYYIVIKHRNHLGVMTSSAISLSRTTTTIDFTDSNNQITYGTNAQTTFGMPSGVVAMWAGNVNSDDIVRYQGSGNDSNALKDIVLAESGNTSGSNLYSFTGYDNGDVDMNGTIRYQGSGNDTNTLKDIILSHPSNTSGSNLFSFGNTLPEDQF